MTDPGAFVRGLAYSQILAVFSVALPFALLPFDNAAAAQPTKVLLEEEIQQPVHLGMLVRFSAMQCSRLKSPLPMRLEIQIGTKWQKIASPRAQGNTEKCPGNKNYEITYLWKIDRLGDVQGANEFGTLTMRQYFSKNSIAYSQIRVFRNARAIDSYLAYIEEARLSAERKAAEEARVRYQERVKELIRSLYYRYGIAGQDTYAAQVEFVISNNYPGFTNGDSLRSCLMPDKDYIAQDRTVPNLNELAQDPTWYPPNNPAARTSGVLTWPENVIPSGDTYILKVERSYLYRDTIGDPWKIGSYTTQVHVTILNDRAYFYQYCSR